MRKATTARGCRCFETHTRGSARHDLETRGARGAVGRTSKGATCLFSKRAWFRAAPRLHSVALMMKRVLFVTTLAVACASEPAKSPTTTTTSSTMPSPTTAEPINVDIETMESPQPTAPPTNMTLSPDTTMSDAQIAAITDAANTGEIEQAKVALRHAKDQRVRDFAQMMIEHHSDAKTKQGMLMSSMNLSDDPTSTSMRISSDGQSALGSLQSAGANDFDKMYIELQVREHRDVLDMLDNKLIPSAHSADFKRALVDFRPKVADHLKRAEDLQQILAKQ